MSGIKSFFGKVPIQAFIIGFVSIWIFYRLSLPVESLYDIEFAEIIVGTVPFDLEDEIEIYNNSERYAFLSYGKHGIAALHISREEGEERKRDFIEVGKFDTFGSAQGLAYDKKNKLLYIADGKNGLVVLNVADPANMELKYHVPQINDARDIFIAGDYAYIADGEKGFYSLLINPLPAEGEEPALWSGIESEPGLSRILVRGRQAFAIGLDNNLHFFKLHNDNRGVVTNHNPITVGTQIHDIDLWESSLFWVTNDELAWIGNPSIETTQKDNSLSIEKPLKSLEVYGDFAFVGVTGHGIEVFDISDLNNVETIDRAKNIEEDRITDPQKLAHWDAGYMEAGYLYVGDGRKGLRAVHVKYELEMDERNFGRVLGSVEDIAVLDKYLYLASCEQGITVLEIEENEDEPGKSAGESHVVKKTSGCPTAIDVNDELVFVINSKIEEDKIVSANIHLYDRTVSYVTPTKLSFDIETPGIARDLVVRDEYIYVADGKAGLQIFTREPTVFVESDASTSVGDLQFDSNSDAHGIFLLGDLAYIAAGYDGLQVVNVEDPTKPQQLSSYEVGFFTRAVYVQEQTAGEHVGKTFAYIVGGKEGEASGMKILDVSNPDLPKDENIFWSSSEPVLDVAVDGATGFVLQEKSGLRIFDFSNPKKFVDKGNIEDEGVKYSKLTLDDHIVFFGKKEEGVKAISVKENGEIFVEIENAGGWTVEDAVSWENYVYIVDGVKGLRIIDISDYKSPSMLSYYATSGPSKGITLTKNDERLYLSNGNKGIEILSVADRSNPTQIGVFPDLKNAIDVAVKSDIAYVATDLGVAILDLINITEIKEVDTIEYEGGVRDVVVKGDYLYVAKGTSRMDVYRIVNPKHPKLVQIPEDVDIYNTSMAKVDGNYLYITGGKWGIRIINISNPEDQNKFDIEFDFEFETENETSDVDVLGRYFVVADGVNRGRIFYFPGEWFTPAWSDTTLIGTVGNQDVTLAMLEDLSPTNSSVFHVVYGEKDGGLIVRVGDKNVKTTPRGFTESPGRANFWELLLKGTNPQRTQSARRLVWGSAGGFMLTLLLMLALSSGTILPATRRIFSSDVFALLLFYLLGSHGPVVFVEDGKETKREGPFREIGPGFTKVDAVSAVVLERTAFQPGCIGGLLRALMGRHPRENLTMRTEDVGINFTRPGERVKGVADLRRQIRLKPEVKAHTRDGIEVKSVVLSLFTLGDPPDVYTITYDGDEKPENLRVIKAKIKDPEDDEWKYPTQVVSGLDDILNPDDKLDAHRFVQAYRRSAGFGSELPEEKPNGWRPYRFFENRVFAAITARPYDVFKKQRIEWTEIPVHLTVSKFRELLGEQLYDNLFRPEEPKPFPLQELKDRLRLEIVNQGILAYRFVERVDGKPIEVDQEMRDSLLINYPEREFSANKVLRSRGIKVITAGFTELTPSFPEVQGHYLYNNWRAPWQQEAIIIQSDHELQAMRMKNHARAQAQKDMIFTLSKILSTSDYSKEALALRVFQALETAAADPATQRLLPRDTLDFMRSLRIMLLR